MRVQFILISALLSVMCWVGAFQATRETYHAGMAVGVIPNLHIRQNFLEAVSGGPVPWHFRHPFSSHFG
jgi:hypothetical protein